MFCVCIADAAGHAAEIHEIHRLWLVDGVSQAELEAHLAALEARLR